MQQAIEVLTREEIILRLKRIFKKHIGKHNAISKERLFKEVFGDIDRFSELELFYYWNKLRVILHDMRKNTFLFVVSERKMNTYMYYVLKTEQDFKVYSENVEQIKKSISRLQERAKRALKEKWYLKGFDE